MPFESQAQRRFMYAKHPQMAKEFEAVTPKGVTLPMRKNMPRKPTAKSTAAGIYKGLK
jgi:hypothetical protein